MGAQNMTVNAVDPQWKGMYRLGGIAAIALVIGYFLITALFVPVYPIPDSGQAMLEYLDGKAGVWWAIISVSALTDFLYAYIAFALYLALKGINRETMVVATGLKWFFAVLELATTWPAFATLITLSHGYAAATTDAQRATFVAAANYATGMVDPTFLSAYTILVPGLGTLLMSLVMRKGIFNKVTAYLGVVVGILGIVSYVGPRFTSALDVAIIPTSLLSAIWFLLVGIRLYRLGQPR